MTKTHLGPVRPSGDNSQYWRNKGEASLGWHQWKALTKSGKAAKTSFWDILKDGASAHTQRDGYAGEWGSHLSETKVGYTGKEMSEGGPHWVEQSTHKWSSWRVRLHKAACLHSSFWFLPTQRKTHHFLSLSIKILFALKKKKRVN